LPDLIEEPELYFGWFVGDRRGARDRRAEALDGVRDVLGEAIRCGRDDWLDDAIVITDGTGRELMTIPFIEALPPRLSEALLAMVSSWSKSP